MATLHQHQMDDFLTALPGAEQLPEGAAGLRTQSDLFLCALGFESRCLTLPGLLDRAGHRATRVVYLEYSTNLHDNAAARPQLLEHLNRMSEETHAVETDSIGFGESLRNVIRAVAGRRKKRPPSVLFDLSVASNQLVLRTMKVLLEFDIRLTVLYSEAAKYYPTQEQAAKKIGGDSSELADLYRGVSSVTISDEHPGYHVEQLPDCLMLFPGFSAERSLAVISEVDPSLLSEPGDRVVWFLGVPHLPEDAWRLDFMRSVAGVQETAPQFEVQTFDYRDTLRKVESVYNKCVGACKFTLSPMGSKMQALGASIFCEARPDVRVMFANPKQYNASHYSEGCKATWKIEFGRLSELRDKLRRIDALELRE